MGRCRLVSFAAKDTRLVLQHYKSGDEFLGPQTCRLQGPTGRRRKCRRTNVDALAVLVGLAAFIGCILEEALLVVSVREDGGAVGQAVAGGEAGRNVPVDNLKRLALGLGCQSQLRTHHVPDRGLRLVRNGRVSVRLVAAEDQTGFIWNFCQVCGEPPTIKVNSQSRSSNLETRSAKSTSHIQMMGQGTRVGWGRPGNPFGTWAFGLTRCQSKPQRPGPEVPGLHPHNHSFAKLIAKG